MEDIVTSARFESWSPADVARWVAEVLELPQYADCFLAEKVDGPTLVMLTSETLEDYLSIKDPLLRKKILGHIKLLRLHGGATAAGDAVPSATHGLGGSPTGCSEGRLPPSPERSVGNGIAGSLLHAGSTGGVRRRYLLHRGGGGGGDPGGRAGFAWSNDSGTGGAPGAAMGRGVVHPQAAAATAGPSLQAGGRLGGGGGGGRSRSSPRGDIGAASGKQTPRPRSESANSVRSCSTSASASEATLYSCYTNPNVRLIEGLNSQFGLDSPSFSRQGSFPSERKRGGFPGAPAAAPGPGPAYYQNVDVIGSRLRPSPPRAAMGRSPRNTTEYLVHNSSGTAAGKYYNSGNARSAKTQAHAFGTSPRMNYDNAQARQWLSPTCSPGPTHYRPSPAFDSTFRTCR